MRPGREGEKGQIYVPSCSISVPGPKNNIIFND
jgi:hypothetical protein